MVKTRHGSWLLAFIVGLLLIFTMSEAKEGTSLKMKYDPIIRKMAGLYAVDPALIHSIISTESDYNRFAVSSKGARGLMQLMPETAKDYGVADVFNAADNIKGGVRFLKDLQATFGNKMDLILAAYNAGQKTVEKYDGVPPYPETKNYVSRVKRLYSRESRTRKTQIYEYRDSNGRLRQTNDIRLALTGGQQP
jgi:soluble lytic murein transglycosylase-like protein